ncbi:hypothetical protein [Lysinibacillus xylanilyticus]|uniref:hypothetical protein n=1 Tax=Lysinibacillus xylanilyticus TaxID=582475 RepID=UPI003D003349
MTNIGAAAATLSRKKHLLARDPAAKRMSSVRKRSANVAAATGFVCAKAKRQQQCFICAKVQRQQKGFICAKAKRQRQQQKRLIERPQEALLCAKAKRQRQCFICAKAKRQQQMFYLRESEASAAKRSRNGNQPRIMV